MATPDDLPLTVPALVHRAAVLHGPREAVVDDTVRLTWTELDVLRRRVARALIAGGIGHGDRIAVQAPNLHEHIAVVMGLQSIGAVAVPLNTRFKGEESADILRRSRARWLFTLTGFLGTDYPALLAGQALPDLQRTVLMREGHATAAWQAFLGEGDGVPAQALAEREAAVRPDDVADIMFTSGTTGRPKGVLMTHGQNIRLHTMFPAGYGLREDDVFVVIAPFFHSMGYKAGWLACTAFGAKVVPVITFDADQLLALIERERISVLPAPPTVFYALLDHPRRTAFDLSSLRIALCGAAIVPGTLVQRMLDELRFTTVVNGYGLTECGGLAAFTRPGDDIAKVVGTVGRPIPDAQVQVVDEAGRPLSAGQPGEVVVKGYMVTQGYLDDPEATAEAIDAQGRLHTGDVGCFDADGYLTITDRLKDMYIAGGFNCYPAEIERILLRMPGIAQVAVIGIPDERLGEVGQAFVIPRPGAGLSEAQVIAWAREHMANTKVPRRVAFVEAFPLNASGKVLKTALRQQAAAAR